MKIILRALGALTFTLSAAPAAAQCEGFCIDDLDLHTEEHLAVALVGGGLGAAGLTVSGLQLAYLGEGELAGGVVAGTVTTTVNLLAGVALARAPCEGDLCGTTRAVAVVNLSVGLVNLATTLWFAAEEPSPGVRVQPVLQLEQRTPCVGVAVSGW